MVPLIKHKFGKNLLAVAARGSFARNTDQPYSDLELFAFLKEMPRDQKKLPYAKMHKIRNALLMTMGSKATFHRRFCLNKKRNPLKK